MQHDTISYDELVASVFDLRHEGKKLYCYHERKNATATTKEKLYSDKKMLKKSK